MKYWALHPVNLFFFLFFNRHKWEVHCGSGWRVSWHMEHQPLGGRVHQLELHNSERKEVHSQENGRQQSRPGQPQLLQVKCFLTWWWNYYYFFYGEAFKYFLVTFSKPRNPDNDSTPWCFIYKGTQIIWEFCSVPKCPKGTVSQKAAQSKCSS